MSDQFVFPEADFPFINAFVEGTMSVLRTHAAAEARLLDRTCVKGPLAMGEVVAVMHLTGAVRGYVALGLPRVTAARLVAALLGVEPGSVAAARLHDGAGELLNMIIGNAKSLLADTRYHFTLTTPSSIVGSDCMFEHKMPVPRLVLEFAVLEGRMLLSTALQPL